MTDGTWRQQPAVERFIVPERLNSQLHWADKSESSLETSHDIPDTNTRMCMCLTDGGYYHPKHLAYTSILNSILCLSLYIIYILHCNMKHIRAQRQNRSLPQRGMMTVQICNWPNGASAVGNAWNKIWKMNRVIVNTFVLFLLKLTFGTVLYKYVKSILFTLSSLILLYANYM